ncbi:hypothetical protein EJ04DRAFT_454717 [Polyplosphaeria fusca]|uniref:Glycoside hydrolase 131 catalytic N-terminal domain-containing protein n=1 Tax=Polyplosphaeria fusca TaxID=682080 RepID=A0A9P4RCQ4_9PLEO|nr:hypothetical protein EJ04DRAFT_454717 [Polyplosphaeria fusca]
MFLVVFLLAATAAAQCSATFDGRIPRNATKALFTSAQSPFNPKYVLGQNVTWDQVVDFPDVGPSVFDKKVGGKPIEIIINDKSIFASSSEGAETALRRSELLVNNKPNTVSGKKTWFMSFRSSPTRPLNLTHEYVLAFHEAQDYQADFYSLKLGTPMHPRNTTPSYGQLIGYQSPLLTPDHFSNGSVLYLQGYKYASPVQTYFIVPFTEGTWHNLGLYLDYNDNVLQVLYSTGHERLNMVTPMLANNLSGAAPTTLGETHFGLQKRPVGANLTNFLYEGEQELGINETIVVGGIWQIQGHPKNCSIA